MTAVRAIPPVKPYVLFCTTKRDRFIQLGGEDLASFGNGVSVAKGTGVAHHDAFDAATGITTLSFTGIGSVVVDQRVGDVVNGTDYTVGTPSRPGEGLSVIIDQNGRVRAYPSFGG